MRLFFLSVIFSGEQGGEKRQNSNINIKKILKLKCQCAFLLFRLQNEN